MSWLSVQLRRVADARAAIAGLAALALVTSFLFAATPRVIVAQSDRALRATVDAATADTRNIAVSEVGRIASDAPASQAQTDPLAAISAQGDFIASKLPASVSALVAARYTAIDTARFKPIGLESRTVRLRYLQGAQDHLRLISGAMPTGRTSQLQVAPGSLGPGATTLNRPVPPPDSLTTFEVAISSASAEDLGVRVGDTVELRTDDTDKLAGWSVAYIAIRVVGIYEVVDPSSDYWFADTSLERPQIRSLSSLTQIDDMTVLMAGDAYSPLLAATRDSALPLRYTWRFQVDTARLVGGDTSGLLTDLRRMDTYFETAGAGYKAGLQPLGVQLSAPVLQTGLLHLAETYVASWHGVSQVLSVAEVGSGAVALLALGLVCWLVGRRRATSVAIWKSRGATRGQAVVGTAVDVGLGLILPAVAGTAAAALWISSRELWPSIVFAGAAVALAAVLTIGTTWRGAAEGTIAADGISRAGNGRSSSGWNPGAWAAGSGPRRIALEAMFVAGALLGAYLLRQRGIAGAGSGVALTSPDPLLAAVPALVGGAAALIVARLLPLPLELLARVAERGRGLVGVLALRRATRRTGDRLLLVALLSMAAVWSFAAVSLSYIGRGSDASSWLSVGAPYRVSLNEGTLPPDLNLAGVPGVTGVAQAATLSAHVADNADMFALMALDLAAYDRMAKGGWLDGIVPQSMIQAEAADASAAPGAASNGEPAAPLPALISTTLAHDFGLRVGDSADLIIGATRQTIRVAAIADAFATMDPASRWVVVARSELGAVLPPNDVLPTEAFVDAGPDAGPAIEAAVAARLPGQADVSTLIGATAGLRDQPDYVAVYFGLAAAAVIAAIYGALAILVALTLSGAERSRESAHLRVLGLSRRESLALSAMEHGPVSLLVIASGIALGVGLFAFLQPSLDLGALVGGNIDIGLPIDGVAIGAIAVVIAGTVGLAILLEAVTESIIKPTAALRRGID